MSFLVCLSLLLFNAALLTAGWSSHDSGCIPSPTPAGLQAQYSSALNDARDVTFSKIYPGLTPLVKENADLIWENGVVGSRILVATAAGSWAASYICTDPGGCAGNTCKEGGECAYGFDSWVTIVPEMKDFFKSSTPSLLRVVQLLGLPPSYATCGGPSEVE